MDYTQERERLYTELKKVLKGEKLQHSLGVEQTAIKLAERHGADVRKAALAGLMHDYCKQMEVEALARKYELYSDAPKTLHGPVAAELLQEKGLVIDPDILDAIRWHTTGKADMTLLEKIVYLADYIEPERDFEGVEELRQEAYDNLNRAVLQGEVMSLLSVIRSGGLIDTDSVEAYNFYRKIVEGETIE